MNNLKNRARVMLTALCVLTVVGGALAFKARATEFLFCTTEAAPNVCTSQLFFRTTAVRLQKIGDFRCSTTSVNGLCPTTGVYQGI